MAVLREVKYLNFQQQKAIPHSAETLFSQYETFRKFVGNLELIVGWYNEVSPWVPIPRGRAQDSGHASGAHPRGLPAGPSALAHGFSA